MNIEYQKLKIVWSMWRDVLEDTCGEL